MSGLEASGWVSKSAAEFAADIEADLRASPAFGPDVDTSGESVLGQLVGVIASHLASVHEAAGVVYASRDPRAASFAGLDVVCSLTGTTREPAAKGSVTLTVNLAAGVTLPAGQVAHVEGQPGNRWVTTAAAVNGGGSAADVAVAAEAETAGPQAANAGTITVIATPYAGWNGVSNGADAEPGDAAEADVVLRARREREITAGGTSPLDAIRAAVAAAPGVSSVSADMNTGDAPDPVRGLAGHSVRCVVQGGTDAAVAAALWASVAAGIATQGATAATVTDASGAPRVVRFSRPSTVRVYMTVWVIYDDATYAGDAALKAALAGVTTGRLAGAPVRTSAAIVAALAVAGVADCTAVLLGRSSGAQYPANLTASPAEVLKVLDVADVTIVRVFG